MDALSGSKNGSSNNDVTLGSWSTTSPVEQELGRLRTGSVELTPAPITARKAYDEMMKMPSATPADPVDYATKVDVIMRIAYPLFFLLFNIVYWPFLYSLRSDTFDADYMWPISNA